MSSNNFTSIITEVRKEKITFVLDYFRIKSLDYCFNNWTVTKVLLVYVTLFILNDSYLRTVFAYQFFS